MTTKDSKEAVDVVDIVDIVEIEHTADVAIRVRGRDLRALFANAARGMFGLMADLEAVGPDVERPVELEAFDTETLLVSWLSELLWLNEEEEIVFVRFEITSLTSTHMEAKVWGGVAPGQQWKQIKAVTFHDLEVVQMDDGYETTLVFDV